MLLKCKMCGGDMQIEHIQNISVYTCEYCGSKITLPQLDNEQKIFRYNRASNFRLQNNYDEAREQFEKLFDFSMDDPEIYWSILLCRYGIEYVEDPKTGKRVPTCHRTLVSSIFDDDDYQSAIKYASDDAKALYESEAFEIDHIQKGILEFSQTADRYDIFICYKETDEFGDRTTDSLAAQALYDKLIDENYRVFFAKETLKSVPGMEYEPYIYSALKSAKVMIVVGSKADYINAPWVKNEWSRFLTQIEKDKDKVLIPVYKGMDPKDLPSELSGAQALNMNALGFYEDMSRGLKKIFGENTQIGAGSVPADGYIEIGFQQLAMGDKEKAVSFLEQAGAISPHSSLPYFGLMVAAGGEKEEFYYKKEKEFSNPKEDKKKVELLKKSGEAIYDFLFLAIRMGDLDELKLCLETGADLNVEVSGKSPICYCIECEKLDALECILASGARPQSKNIKLDGIPIFKCVDHGFTEGLKLLLKYGESPNAICQGNYTVLSHAIRKSQKDICEVLLQNGADVNKNSEGVPTYLHVFETENQDVIDYIISNQNVDLSLASEQLDRLLVFLILNLSVGGVKKCLEAGANPNIIINGLTPLCYAVLQENTQIVEHLINAGAKVNVHSVDNTMCPLSLACEGKNVEIMQLLLRSGAIPDFVLNRVVEDKSTDEDGTVENNENTKSGENEGNEGENKIVQCTPMIICIDNDFIQGAELLLNHGSDPSFVYDKNQKKTVFTYAIYKSRTDFCDLFLNHGADINAPSNGVPTYVYVLYADDVEKMIAYVADKGVNLCNDFMFHGQKTDIFHFALKRGLDDTIPVIVDKYGIDRLRSKVKSLRFNNFLHTIPAVIHALLLVATFVGAIVLACMLFNYITHGFSIEGMKEAFDLSSGFNVGTLLGGAIIYVPVGAVVWFFIIYLPLSFVTALIGAWDFMDNDYHKLKEYLKKS